MYDPSAFLISTDQPGLYLKTRPFRAITEALERGFFRLRTDTGIGALQSTGLISRQDIARSSHLDKFPQFAMRLVAEIEAAGEGRDGLAAMPSACLCVYPWLHGRGVLPRGGVLTTVTAPCLRNEELYGPERMRAFTMSEYVFAGLPADADAFRDDMVDRVTIWLADLGLNGRLETGNDPFFGRLGEMLIEQQRANKMKLELLLPVWDGTDVACLSFNSHRELFGLRWDLKTPDGAVAHSACVGVGLERLALAMLHRHGADMAAWPQAFRRDLA